MRAVAQKQGAQPRSEEKPARDAERTRARLLAAATGEFAERGFEGARIDRIAARAGVNKQLLYYYFGGKEALYVTILEEAYAGIRAAEAELRLSERSPADGIRDLTLFTFRYHVRHPELISLVRTENLHKARFLKRSSRISGLNSPLIAAVTELLARGEALGEFRSDVDPIKVYVTIAAMSFYYLSNHWTLQTNFGRDLMEPARLDDWGEHIVEVVLSYLTRHEKSRATADPAPG